jgi:nitrate reductase NapAB chaperone NapD
LTEKDEYITQLQTNVKESVNQEIQTEEQQQLIVIINPNFISSIEFLSSRNVSIEQCMKMLN